MDVHLEYRELISNVVITSSDCNAEHGFQLTTSSGKKNDFCYLSFSTRATSGGVCEQKYPQSVTEPKLLCFYNITGPVGIYGSVLAQERLLSVRYRIEFV